MDQKRHIHQLQCGKRYSTDQHRSAQGEIQAENPWRRTVDFMDLHKRCESIYAELLSFHRILDRIKLMDAKTIAMKNTSK